MQAYPAVVQISKPCGPKNVAVPCPCRYARSKRGRKKGSGDHHDKSHRSVGQEVQSSRLRQQSFPFWRHTTAIGIFALGLIPLGSLGAESAQPVIPRCARQAKNAPLTEIDGLVYPHAEIARFVTAWLTYAAPARRPHLVVREHQFDSSILLEPDEWLRRMPSRQSSFSRGSELLEEFVDGVMCLDINNSSTGNEELILNFVLELFD
ncbi:hypothetical protein BDV38DRAFT_18879 [Aspergillus pseudotamarii]|uniref:Uncharacterized protein n=1 Tax=Aspergillus pseudotamarii TaxID=132259 RepID=A0A5N6T2K6_ASPPS|nr:uncharacterized protein BDV38DRAFT_18879 [Aspergillus pseudotamarii]KAE8140509.1 hypothetical protein BDV38DRAFT_18879 [Aspergillus pseudotamarii]